jgi:hypothetical protein
MKEKKENSKPEEKKEKCNGAQEPRSAERATQRDVISVEKNSPMSSEGKFRFSLSPSHKMLIAFWVSRLLLPLLDAR